MCIRWLKRLSINLLELHLILSVMLMSPKCFRSFFPASLGDIGTPKAIAMKLEQQKRMIEDLEQTLDQERTLHDTDINGILRSVDAQLDASRKGVQSERRQLALKSQFAADQAAQNMAEVKTQHEEELRSQKEKINQDRRTSDLAHKTELEELKAKVQQMEEDFAIEKSLFTATLAKEKSHYKRSQAKMHKKHKTLSEKYANLRAGVGAGGLGMETEMAKDGEGNIVTDEAGNPVMVAVARIDSGASPSSDRGRGSGSPLGDKSVASTDCSSYGRSGSTGSTASGDDVVGGAAADRAQLNLIKRLRQVSCFYLVRVVLFLFRGNCLVFKHYCELNFTICSNISKLSRIFRRLCRSWGNRRRMLSVY